MEPSSHESRCDAVAAGAEAEDRSGDRMTILLDFVIFCVKICSLVSSTHKPYLNKSNNIFLENDFGKR